MTLKQIKDALLNGNIDKTNQAILEVYEMQFKHYHIASIIDVLMNYIAANQYVSEVQASKVFMKEIVLRDAYELIKDSICKWDIICDNKTQKSMNEEKLKKVKSLIEDKVKVLIALNDEIDLYENLLIKHTNTSSKEDFVNDDLANDMVSFVFKDNDRPVINSKIKELLKILPVRMTMDKWNEYIEDSMGIYYGGYKSDLEQFIQSIKETFAPEIVKGYKKISLDGISIIHDLKDVDYTMLSEAKAEEYLVELNKLSITIETMFDICSSFTEIINRLLILSIGPSYQIAELHQLEPRLKNVSLLIDYIEANDNIIEEDIFEYLTGLEGVGESWLTNIDTLESIINMVLRDKMKILEETGLKSQYDEISIAKILLSTSLFANIDELSNDRGPQVDKGMLIDSVEGLISWMNNQNDKLPRETKRAKINQLMYMLPVIFQRPQELYDYVLQSLVSCSNENERKIVYNKYKDIQMEYM